MKGKCRTHWFSFKEHFSILEHLFSAGFKRQHLAHCECQGANSRWNLFPMLVLKRLEKSMFFRFKHWKQGLCFRATFPWTFNKRRDKGGLGVPRKNIGVCFSNGGPWDRVTQNMGYKFVTDNPLVLGTFNTPINKHGKQISSGVQPLGCAYNHNQHAELSTL